MKTRKLLSLATVSLVIASILAGCSSPAGSAGSAGGAGGSSTPASSGSSGGSSAAGGSSINIWCWDKSDSRTQMHSKFTEATGISVELTAVESKDMTQKLQTTLAAGGDMPDIAWLESTYRGKLLSLDIWEDITAAPYSFDKSNVLDYLIPLETAGDGSYVGPECPSVAGMAFKRELAKEYLGTDDPAELEKLLPDWDAFIKAGQEVSSKSGGKVFMMSSLGAAGIMLKGQITESFIDGNKLNLDASMKPILERLVELKTKGICDVLDYDSPEEGASYAGNEHIFYPCANWSVEFTIKSNDKDGLDRWGFMLPPGGPFPMGGTVMGVPKKAVNKEGAVTYIKYFFGSEDGAKLQRDYKGNFSPYKPLYDQPDFYSAEDPYFHGQNVLQEISQRVLPNIKSVRLPSEYDQDINDVYNLAVKSINASNGTDISVDDLIAQMKDDLINKNPDITE